MFGLIIGMIGCFQGMRTRGWHRGRGAFGDEFGRAVIALCHSGRRPFGEIDPGVFPMMRTDQALLLGEPESSTTRLDKRLRRNAGGASCGAARAT